ncbi:MAG: hypothetical protein PHN61_14900, partial [Methanothrix sp.]|nr:hypothetical protein [Methanothrix sp.]
MKSIPPSLPAHPDSEINVNSNSLQDLSSNEASLLATVRESPEMSQVYLENTGLVELHEVQIVGAGRSLGILSQLVCGEKKVLAVSGSPSDLRVTALDPSESEVLARVQYIPSEASENPTTSVSEETVLSTKSAPAAKSMPVEKKSDLSALLLTITANRTEGRSGDVVGFRCLVKNLGSGELSDIRVSCAGKMASTKFLPAGEELFLDGAMQIANNTRLSAGVRALDAQGKIHTNNTSLDIWKISPLLKLQVSGSRRVHRGESVSLELFIENKGAENLTEIIVRDSLGEMGRIALLEPGVSKVLQKEMTVLHSQEEVFSVLARDQQGSEVYASERFDLQVLNSSLLIRSDPSMVGIYPGEPVEFAWILSNNGEE